MAKAYYGSRISDNRTKTPEGFLICHNVPIARTGWQKYYGQEIGLTDDMAEREIQVFRSEEEVFHPATLASFEGKTITDEHPNDWVKPDNMIMLDKGHVQNVRRGQGDESDLLIADLFITDPNVITIVEKGLKKEVSCGYDCVYEQVEDTKFQQKQIRGNHVAVVNNGRAGNRVAIKDSSTKATEKQQEGGNKKMAKGKISKNLLAAIGLKQFIQDADPDEIVEATKAMNEDAEAAEPKEEPKEDKFTQDEEDPVMQMLQQILDRLEALEGGGSGEEMNDLDTLEEELGEPSQDMDNEEAITIPAEEMDSEELTEPGAGYVEPDSERPKNPIGDRAAALDTIRSLKPMLAAIPDPKERRKAADSLARLIRSTASPKRNNDAYGNIAEGTRANAKKIAKDSEEQYKDNRANGKEYAKKFNPHYKG